MKWLQSSSSGAKVKIFRTACLLYGLAVLCGAQLQTPVPTPQSSPFVSSTVPPLTQNAPKGAMAPSILIGRVMSGDRPIVESEVTLYGLVGQCIPDPCIWVNVPVEHARTDSHGFFSMDLSKAGANVRNAIADKSVVTWEQPRPGTFYLVATGGCLAGRPNAAIKLMLAMANPPPSGWVTINELTTVASVMSLVGLMGPPHAEEMAPAASGDLAMMSAFVSPETGRAQPLLSEGVNRPTLINTLADILSGCIRSDSPDAPACGRLFAATPDTGTPSQKIPSPPALPTDTLLAMRNLAFYRTRNVNTAFGLVPVDPPYTPVLAHPPNAWMLSVNFARGGLKNPTEIAADTDTDTIWIANSGRDTVVELSTNPEHFGAPLSGSTGFSGGGLRSPLGILVAPLYLPKKAYNVPANLVPSVWVANRGGKSVTRMLPLPSGAISLKEISGNSLDAPSSIERFPRNEVDYQLGQRLIPYEVFAVVSSRSKAVSFFRADGSQCGPALNNIGLDSPGAIGICYFGANFLCVVNSGADDMVLVDPPGHDCSGTRVANQIDGGGISSPQYFVEDWTGNLGMTMWITNRGNNSVSAFAGTNEAAALAGSPFTGGGLNRPAGIVSAEIGQIWVANNGANTLTELSAWSTPPGGFVSPPGGFTGAGLNHPWGLAIDRHGNLWAANQGGESVTMFLLGAKR